MEILILCTGNSCRSQMAEGFMKSLDNRMEVYSAGTIPAKQVNRLAIKVMAEIGLDISAHRPKMVEKFINKSFDYVITVCDNANETCPMFLGQVKNRLHIGFEDPSDAIGSDDEVIGGYRKIRDEIEQKLKELYNLKIQKEMDNSNEELKKLVREKYGKIINQTKRFNESSCCGAGGCCSTPDYTVFSENYTNLKGYNPDADLGLGCGIPTEFAAIKEGDTVIDLGSGAGNDCFVARAIVGETGKVIGIDFTESMIEKAKENAEKLGYKNVQFRKGDIEDMPIGANIADVVVSNCVLNLVPNKVKAFAEIYRVLKPGGHLSVSDIVIIGKLPDKIQKAGEMYAGCVSGAIDKTEYLNIMKDVGFADVAIKKDKKIDLPDEILIKYISQEEIIRFRESNSGIFSITVYAAKPICGCKSGCC